MVDGNAVRVALVTLAGACAVSGGVVMILPRILPSDGEGTPSTVMASPAAPATPSAPPESELTTPTRGPSFDTVRVAPDGSGLVAGQARPGAVIDIMTGETTTAQATADEDGRFVAFLNLPPSDGPLVLSLRDGAGTESQETVILAAPPQARAAAVEPARPALPAGPQQEPEADAVAQSGPTPAMPPPSGSGPSEEETGDAPAIDEPPVEGDISSAMADPTVPAAEQEGQPPVLLSDAEGVRLLQPALPPGADAEILDTVALDAIAYDGTGEVTISGRGTGGGSVRLYLDNEAVSESAIQPDGRWSAHLDGTAPGLYTLRVDQVDPSGEVVSRIETPFQREERDGIAALSGTHGTTGADQAIRVRTVQPGNTLWAIARERYGEPMMYVRVFEANRDRIRDPDLIYPGQVFVLPTGGQL
ncbi:LysM peptidoglycan-binding domain-containing protein [Rubellimicrobium rubrum]|uniref:LysM peptidoglycan-binding domain-containing protein n=1 Tax=Rubellimicrobium rubrum TaxID=2585369 RepID=A0A5C4N9A5_9RHOB|nr:Ig-like domain-containing protein [Rubellimicrobium rubrum]TNC52852.1 LysM peptidoglycan-binding domain-containing protein [Rubellimicrobium rubrum]